MEIMFVKRRVAPALCILVLCAGLSGCIAAAPVLMAMSFGSVAMAGFEGYKLVQLSGGRSVEVAFPGKDGKTTPPEPISPVRSIAVWPGDEGDVRFAERLQSSARFTAELRARGTPIDRRKRTFKQDPAKAACSGVNSEH